MARPLVVLQGMRSAADASRTRTEFHRHETPEGVLTWFVNTRLAMRNTWHGLASEFELDGEPLTVAQGRAIKRRYGILD